MWCLSRNSMPSVPWQPSGAQATASPADPCPGTVEERMGLLQALQWGRWWGVPPPWTPRCKLCLSATLCRAAIVPLGQSKVGALALLQEVFYDLISVCPLPESSRFSEIFTSPSATRMYPRTSRLMDKPLYNPSKIALADSICCFMQLESALVFG